MGLGPAGAATGWTPSEAATPANAVRMALLASATPHLDAVLAALAPAAAAPRPDARLDGRRVAVEAGNELVLRCGKASITMTDDGKVTLRGFQIVTQADGVQKIRGATVQIS